MRKLVLILALIGSTALAGYAQTLNTAFRVISNNGSTLTIAIDAYASTSTNLGPNTLVFQFNSSNLSFAASPSSGSDYSYQNGFGSGAYSASNVTRPQTNEVSINIDYAGGTSNAISTNSGSPTELVRLTFTTSNSSGSAGLTWDTGNSFGFDDGFNGYTLSMSNSGSPAQLPVSLTSFHALVEGNSTKTTWATASEINNRGFYLERSVDATNWEVVNFINTLAPAGNSHDVLNYTYIDNNVYQPWTGVDVFYYRLRQQDFNGTEEYVGDVQAVRFGGIPVTGGNVEVYPTPATDVLNFKAAPGTEYSVMLQDLTGRTVLAQQFEGRLQLDVTTISAGTYSAVVSSQDGTVIDSRKVIITR